MKVAAGALATLAVARVTNLTRWLEQAKASGYWIYGTVVEGGTPLWEVEIAERAVVVLGSEQRGIRAGVRATCDVELTLPMVGLESLNVGVAGGVFVYEWRRQRSVGEKT
jgi:23S rRNA (guanosine2251-2'-O)-methyltransferase